MLEFTYSIVDFEYFLMILARIVSFIQVAPFFRLPGVPGRVKVCLSAVMALLVFGNTEHTTLHYEGVMEFGFLVAEEALVGLSLGFALYACDAIITFAGTLMDLYIGFSMAQEYNPVTQQQNSVTGTMYDNMIMLLLLTTNMYHYVVRAICDTYQLMPVGGIVVQWEHLYQAIISYVTNLFLLGFRISLPVFACMLVMNAVLGVMAKVAPQMNMFAVGMQIKIIVGLIVIMLTLYLLPYVADFLATEMKTLFVDILKGFYDGRVVEW